MVPTMKPMIIIIKSKALDISLDMICIVIKVSINGKINKLQGLSFLSLNCNNTIKIIRTTKDALDEKSPWGIMTTINKYFILANKKVTY
jgi:hypothetical protein